MPLQLNFAERNLLLNLNLGPGPFVDLWSAVAFRAVLAAERLGVFTALAAGPRSAEALANHIDADLQALSVLLESLLPLGYLTRNGNGYANSAMTAKWFLPDAEANVAPYLSFWADVLAELGDDLEDAVRRGAPDVNLYEWIEGRPQTSEDFQRGMVALAHIVKGEIVAGLKLPAAAQRLLDVGGGHATYSIALCEKHPQLSATIFDSARALATGRDVVAAAGLDGRISFQPGNFLTDDLGAGFDVVLLFNIVHGFTPEQNQELVAKAAQALRPGGCLALVEQIAGSGGSGASLAINRLLGLAYFFTLGGRVYDYEEIAGWFSAAGVRDLRRRPIRRAAGTSLIVGTRA